MELQFCRYYQINSPYFCAGVQFRKDKDEIYLRNFPPLGLRYWVREFSRDKSIFNHIQNSDLVRVIEKISGVFLPEPRKEFSPKEGDLILVCKVKEGGEDQTRELIFLGGIIGVK